MGQADEPGSVKEEGNGHFWEFIGEQAIFSLKVETANPLWHKSFLIASLYSKISIWLLLR